MQIRLNLESKFIVLASTIILIGSAVVNSWIVTIYHNQLISEAEKKALLLAKSTTISFTNTLLYEELDLVEEGGLLENNINDIMSDSGSAVTGMTVFDNDGVVIASNDYKQYLERTKNRDLELWNSLTEAHLFQTADGKSFEITTPLHISTKRFGTLKIQFTLAEEHAILEAFRKMILLITIGMAAIGILIAFLVARTLARPIKRLASEMRKVQDSGYIASLNSKRRDEIGELQRGFVDMLHRLKAAADERERQQYALVQTEKLASVGTLVSGLAHEINNPLAGLRNCLRRIMKRPENESQTRKYAKLMDDALLRIEKIVRDLLNFSRKKELVMQRTNLNNIIKSACSLVDYRLKKQKIKLKQQLTSNLAEIQGAAQHLEQVFVNLLLNAVDATYAGGCISIKTETQNNKVIAEVTDKGPRIPKEIRDKIFDPFFTTKSVGKGTGLGLSVAKAIVEEHKGSIEIENHSEGVTFRLSFPKSVDTDGRNSKVSAAILAGGQSKRMGMDKAQLTFGGKAMIKHVIETVLSCVKDVMIISNQPEYHASLGLPIYSDEVQSCGPLAGIYTALLHSKSHHCLVAACDLPFLAKAMIQFLCENCAAYDVLVFESDNGLEPLCAVYSKHCLPIIQEQIKHNRYKVSDFYEKVNTHIVRLNPDVAFYDHKAFININTREELQQAHELLKETSTNNIKQDNRT